MAPTKKAPQPVVVEPRPDGRWAVQRDKGQRASSLHKTQAAAEKAARQIAGNQGLELVVKGANGRIQRKDSHGRESRTKG
jgi:hypothetical protein